MLVTAMPTPSARIHEPTSAGVAPNASAAWKINAAELVKPTSTATNPAATAANEMSLARDTEARLRVCARAIAPALLERLAGNQADRRCRAPAQTDCRHLRR